MKKLKYYIAAILINYAILYAAHYVRIAVLFGPGGCGIEGVCSSHYNHLSSILFPAFVAIILLAFNVIYTTYYLKINNISSGRVLSGKWRMLLIFLFVVAFFSFIVPAGVFKGRDTIREHRQMNMLKVETERISIPSGCQKTADKYSQPGLTTTYNCEAGITNGILYQSLKNKLAGLGYTKYYDDTFGSSYYNLYQFGYKQGNFSAVFIFTDQNKFSPDQASQIANKAAGGYKLNLYDNSVK